MTEADYRRVLAEMRLANGVLFPIPITLPIPSAVTASVGDSIALRNSKNELLAILIVEEKFAWDWRTEAQHIPQHDRCASPFSGRDANVGRFLFKRLDQSIEPASLP